MIQLAYYRIINCFSTTNQSSNGIELNNLQDKKLNWYQLIFPWKYQDLYLNCLQSNDKRIMRSFKQYLILGFILELLIIALASIVIFVICLIIKDKSNQLNTITSITNVTLVIVSLSLIVIFSCVFYLRFCQVNLALKKVGVILPIINELSMRRVFYRESTITLPNYLMACQTPPIYLNESRITEVSEDERRNSSLMLDSSPRYEP